MMNTCFKCVPVFFTLAGQILAWSTSCVWLEGRPNQNRQPIFQVWITVD